MALGLVVLGALVFVGGGVTTGGVTGVVVAGGVTTGGVVGAGVVCGLSVDFLLVLGLVFFYILMKVIQLL